ncbi:uncharacterized protein L201_002992 [Kwoniella dendrophila CBS 6074]|uniref:Uncharacterized protein n=1 Tax=Kwoniella dendrophila CBS 6074 TaxID=1295534 RepID=A0AAX4JTG3_9TREE
MAIVEDITVEDDEISSSAITKEKLIDKIEKLSKELTVPVELVQGFMASQDEDGLAKYRFKALKLVKEIKNNIELSKEQWEEIEPEVQLRIIENVIRLNGEDDPWSSHEIRLVIEDILPFLSSSIPILILPTLKPYFSSHPSLSTSTSRALNRPIGGEIDSKIDLHDNQPFKDPSSFSWGIINLLIYSINQLNQNEIENNIGMILPPTLILMDDWEPSYRFIGCKILHKWINKIDIEMIKRMGINKLLINSLIHSISLSSNPPLKGLLSITLNIIDKFTLEKSKERIELYSEIIDKGIIQSWLYSPSGIEGRQVLININEMLIEMIDVMGTGIIRWLKNIIPNLLQPLQYPPTYPVLPHYQSNLNCLLIVMRAIRKTGRLERWRGQILNILCRLWVQMKEKRGINDSEDEDHGGSTHKQDFETQIESLIKQIFKELAEQIPSIKEEEFSRLMDLSPGIFGDLIPSSSM